MSKEQNPASNPVMILQMGAEQALRAAGNELYKQIWNRLGHIKWPSASQEEYEAMWNALKRWEQLNEELDRRGTTP